MANTLKHKFVSAKVDDPDSTLVRPLNWNDEHTFSGGGNGQVLTYLSSASDHVTWTYPQFINVTSAPYNTDNSGTTSVNAVIASLFAAGYRRLYFPAGTYKITGARSQSTDGLIIPSGAEIFGDGASTIFSQDVSSYFGLVVNPGSGGTSNPANNSTGIYLHDFTVYGQSDNGSFSTSAYPSEFDHTIAISAVTRVTIERVKCLAIRGDGVYIGSGNVAGVERHNFDITVRDCLFDGVNNLNRNGISVIDCTNLLVEGCHFKNLTRAGYPGAIDMEPDAAYNVLRSLKYCHNLFELGGGATYWSYSIHAITYTTPPQDIVVDGNMFIGNTGTLIPGYSIFAIATNATTVTNATYKTGLKIVNNTLKNSTRPIGIGGMCDVLVENNTLDVSTHGILIADQSSAVYSSRNIKIKNNYFYKVGSISQAVGIIMGNVKELQIHGNTFEDIGVGGIGYALWFSGGTSDYVSIIGNTVLDTVGNMNYGIFQNVHTFTAAHNVLYNNFFNNLPNLFEAFRTDSTYTTVEFYDTTTLPDSFPVGTSISLSTDASLPGVEKRGVLKTERWVSYPASVAATNRRYTIQWYTVWNNADSVDSLPLIYFRKAQSTGNTWSAWKLITGT